MFFRICIPLLLLLVVRCCDCFRSPMTTRNPLVLLTDVKEQVERSQAIMKPELASLIEDYKKDLLHNVERIPLGNVSAQCMKSLQQVTQDLGKPYTMTMLDAWGKPEAGLKQGNTKWVGRYSECREVHADNFGGRYCTLDIGQTPQTPLGPTSAPFTVAMCLPDACSEEDTNEMVQPLSGLVRQVVGAVCLEPSTTYSATDVIALIITCTLGLLVILGTVYDIITNIRKEQRHKELFYESDVIPILEQDRSKLGEIAISFSIIQNTKNLLKTEQRAGDIHALHGLRFISMTWVILGHTCVFSLSALDNITDFAKYFATTKSFQAIANASYSVDSFFFLSGLLVAYLGLREMNKRGGKMNVLVMYLYRYLRLTPAYAFSILFMISLYTKMGDAPMFVQLGESLTPACQKYWWTNILYINNIHPTEMAGECFAWGWYLANDMQFYLVAPLILLLMYKKPLAGNLVLAFGIIASMAITGGLSSYYKEQPMVVGMALLTKAITGNPSNNSGVGFPAFDVTSNVTTAEPYSTAAPQPNPFSNNQFWSDLYAKPWCRIAVYFIGMATGFILYDTKGQRRMNKVFVTIMWAVTAIVALSVIYGLTPAVIGAYSLPVGVAALYNAVSRPLWALSLAWVTIACVHGYGGPINTFLSWNFFIPLSRLTYCCYLVHPLVLWWFYMNREVLMHFEINTTIAYFLATLTLSVGVAYVLAMLVEFPFIGILKVLFPRERHKKESDRVAIINDTDDATQA